MGKTGERRQLAERRGRHGEALAALLLCCKGYRILGRRVRTRAGEIDLVAQDGDTVVFVEVRFRASDAFGTPQETVTAAKRRRLVKTARFWVQARRMDAPMRFDVVALSPKGTLHIPAAFDANGAV